MNNTVNKHQIKDLAPKKYKKGEPRQGYYTVINKDKYIGDASKIIFRSSWEKKYCVYCDTSPNVIEWTSEPFSVQYFNPIDQKLHKYYPDFLIKIKRNGVIERVIVEVKPTKYLKKPEIPKKKSKKALNAYYYQANEFIKNMAKIKAVQSACIENNLKFEIVTESFFNK